MYHGAGNGPVLASNYSVAFTQLYATLPTPSLRRMHALEHVDTTGELNSTVYAENQFRN